MNKHKEHHLFTKENIRVITTALLTFSYEIEKKVENAYLNSKKVSLPFSLEDITCVKNCFLDLYRKFKDKHENTEQIKILLYSSIYRRAIVYEALSECAKNFKKYEKFNLGVINREELHSARRSLKELFPELESQSN